MLKSNSILFIILLPSVGCKCMIVIIGNYESEVMKKNEQIIYSKLDKLKISLFIFSIHFDMLNSMYIHHSSATILFIQCQLRNRKRGCIRFSQDEENDVNEYSIVVIMNMTNVRTIGIHTMECFTFNLKKIIYSHDSVEVIRIATDE